MANPASNSKSSKSGSSKKVRRIGRTMRGYDRKAVDKLLQQKENELAEVHGQLERNKALLDQAQAERVAFLRSLDVAARSADELVEEATENATRIRLEAQDEAERVRRAALTEASEIVAVSKADMAEFETTVTEHSEQMVAKIEADKDALSRYQTELSSYLYQLGEYLMRTSADPTIALPIEEQPAITGGTPDDTIVLSELEAPTVDEDFAEFFSDDVEQDKARDWILKEG